MSAQPTIGVSTGFTDYGDYIGLAFSRPLGAVGSVPFVLPYLETEEARADVLDRLDGLVLAVGRDIDPHRYGAEPHPALTETSAHRDASELALALEAIDRGIPILGICRGMQILNVALGGTLYRDRSEFPEGARDHPGGDWARWELVCAATLGRGAMPEHPTHALEVAEGSDLADALGTGDLSVNSYHHQAIRTLGEGLEAVAWAPDGIVEAVELRDAHAPVLGAQWELQESWQDDDRFLQIFRRFVAAAARSRDLVHRTP